jgi:hypothetical protein
MQSTIAHHPASRPQFSLLALFEYTTLCCILAALTGVLGIGPSIGLMFLGLALSARQGWLALAMFMTTSLAAEVTNRTDAVPISGQPLMIIFAAACICGWYRWRARRFYEE